MRLRPQRATHRVREIPTVHGVREPRSADNVVAERLRSVLAEPVGGSRRRGPAAAWPGVTHAGGGPAAGVWQTPVGPSAAATPALAELAEVGQPLRWSDIISAWPD